MKSITTAFLGVTTTFPGCKSRSPGNLAHVRPLGYTNRTALVGRHRGLSFSAYCVNRWPRGDSANRFSSPEVTLLETMRAEFDDTFPVIATGVALE